METMMKKTLSYSNLKIKKNLPALDSDTAMLYTLSSRHEVKKKGKLSVRIGHKAIGPRKSQRNAKKRGSQLPKA